MPADGEYTTIPVRYEVRDRVRRQKRCQETYSELLDKMVDMYDPSVGNPQEDTKDEAGRSL